MKPQDILFIIILAALLFLKKPKYFVVLGLICICIAGPLFHLQIFFTAQRLVEYAAGFLAIAIIMIGFMNRK